MDVDINHIWDLPVETSIVHTSVHTTDGEDSSAPPHATKRPLFLSSDEEEDAVATKGPSIKKNPTIDALFEGIDDPDDGFQELAPPLDLDVLRREADARNTRAVRTELGASIPLAALSTATDGKKKRKPLPKLDEARLLGRDGLPQLIKDTKNFKPKGKGHEAADLDRVLQVYQFWTHKLYPKTRFKETVDRVEKLCHSKRMQVWLYFISVQCLLDVVRQVALSVWRDEGRNSDTGLDLVGPTRGNAVAAAAVDRDTPSSSPSPSPTRPRLRRHGAAMSDSEGDSDGLPSSSDASRPPLSSPDRDEAAVELDAFLDEEALHASASTEFTNHTWKKPRTWSGRAAMDEDDNLWNILEIGSPAPVSTAASIHPNTDDDEDMWDIVRELEQEQDKDKESSRQSNSVQEPPAAVNAQANDDLDDLYL
ncbi:replication fork protection component Swi3-domain-containing protein [Multifurca ochricompacta]|uniref:Chromosome segregation in meiosis protein n=1 Tax=Multifurca ochricompacta TaxID=376703 RepID=A0AAD4MAA2_9AGAM|nr:replication fork protection component Swi3-domain-containing protein [Multifurca ochricompacta]